MAHKNRHDAVTTPGVPSPAVLAEASEPATARPPESTTPPEWVTKARALSGKTGEPNGAWHDYFKEPLPTTPPIAKWSGKDATYSQYEGGRVLAEYHEGGFFAVLTTPIPLAKILRG